MSRRTYGTGTVNEYDTGSGKRWSIRYRISRDGQMQRFHERGFTTKKAAERALRKRLTERDEGTFVPPSEETFQEYAQLWLERRARDWRASTRHSYERNLRLHLYPSLGSRSLQSITPQLLEATYSRLGEGGRQDHASGSGLSTRSVRYLHTIVKAVLQDAVDKGVLSRNPAALAKPPASKDRGQMNTWTKEQVTAFLASQEQTELGPLWRLLATTGMRRGEALGLSWEDVDFDRCQIRVRRSLVDADWGVPTFNDPKTESGWRTITVDQETLTGLRRIRTRQAQERLLVGKGYRDYGLVFCWPDGTPRHPDRISRRFRELCDRANLPPIRLHDLRHTNATLLLESGVPAHVVQKRLGHGHVAITLGTYARVTPTMDDDAAARIAGMIG